MEIDGEPPQIDVGGGVPMDAGMGTPTQGESG